MSCPPISSRKFIKASGDSLRRIFIVFIAFIQVFSVLLYSVPIASAEFGDDYPWKTSSVDDLSPLGFAYRNCTDYAAWRLNVALGGSASNIKFSYALGSMQGNAIQWKDYTVSKYGADKVNDTPTEGAVAWWGTGTYGHVGVVGRIINENTIVIEDYNKHGDGNYDAREVSRGTSNWPQKFLHIADTPAKIMPEPHTPGSPIGDLEAYRIPGGIRVHGWTLDPDTAASIQTHVYAGNGEAKGGNPAVALSANLERQDVAQAYPGYGPYHGFSGTVASGYGDHRVCAYGINVGSGHNRRYDCTDVKVSAEPYGAFDSIRREPSGVRVTGWAIDPDTGNPVAVHFYGGTGTAGSGNPGFARTANADRPDVGRNYPGYGNAHGYDTVLPLGPGTHKVCAYAINASGTAGSNKGIGCKNITISPDPFGAFDTITVESDGVRVSGWAIDPDTKEPIQVHFYGGTGTAGSPNPGFARTANGIRSDVARAYPGYGEYHGYNTVLALSRGTHKVCAYAINYTSTAGSHRLIGCKSVTY